MSGKKLIVFAVLTLLGWSSVLGQQTSISHIGTKLTFTFAGDLMAHVPNYTVRPYDYIYENVKYLLQSDDLSFVNLETPVVETAPYSSYPLFNVHAEYIWPAIQAGFDVFSLANNHAGDRGSNGIAKTRKAMEDLAAKAQLELGRNVSYGGLRPAGASTPEPFTLVKIPINGMTIGFVSIAEYSNVPSTTPFLQTVFYTNPDQATRFLEWIKKIRSQVDFLVLAYHWGTEYSTSQTKAGAAFSQQLVEAGVDVLWGHHPHVLQPWYRLKSPRGDAVVLPSMGNFVSGQAWFFGPRDWNLASANRGDSALFRLSLNIGDDKTIRIDACEPVLISNFKTQDGGVTVRTMMDLSLNLAEPWVSFYKQRFRIMSAFYPDSLESSTRLGLPSPIRIRNMPEK